MIHDLCNEDLAVTVSMKSGLEGRNNWRNRGNCDWRIPVSMKSGLEGRNNMSLPKWTSCAGIRLNEVRPRRPEQCSVRHSIQGGGGGSLNEVRPRRPEQW